MDPRPASDHGYFLPQRAPHSHSAAAVEAGRSSASADFALFSVGHRDGGDERGDGRDHPMFLAGRAAIACRFTGGAGFSAAGPRAASRLAGMAWITLFALIDGTLFQGFLARGLERTGAGLGSVMIDSQPLAVAIMARFLFQEWIGPLGWLGLLIGLAGISCIGLPDEWILGFFQGQGFDLGPLLTFEQEVWTALFQQGEWLMLMAALSMAVGTILIRYVVRWADPIAATGWHMVLGGAPLLALSIAQSMGTELAPWQGISLSGWLEMSYATIFGSAIAYGVFFYIAAQGNLTSLSALTFLTPVFALLFSTLLLSESLSLLQWSGVMLTLLSIYLINQRTQLASWLSTQLSITALAKPPQNSATAEKSAD